MASPAASIAGLVAVVIFFFCYICWKLLANKVDEDVSALAQTTTLHRTTASRTTTQRINGTSLVSDELTALNHPCITPINVRKPSPIGWSDSTTMDSNLPHLPPRKREGSQAGVTNKLCPYPAENPMMPHLPYPSPLSQHSAPYPVETTSNDSMPYLPTIVATTSAPYPAEITLNNRLAQFSTVAQHSSPYPIADFQTDPLPYPSEFAQTSAPHPVDTPPKIQTSHPNRYINIGEPEVKQTSTYSSKAEQSSALYSIEEPPERLLLDSTRYEKASAPSVEEPTNKSLPYPEDTGGIQPYPKSLKMELPFPPEVYQSSAPYPIEDSRNKSPYSDTISGNLDKSYVDSAEPLEISSEHLVTNTNSEEQLKLPEPKERGQLQSKGPEEEYPSLCSVSYRRHPYLEPCGLIQPKNLGFKQYVMPFPAENQRPGTNTSEEDSELVDTFRIGFVKPPEPGFKVASMARGRTTTAVGSLGAAGPRGLNSGAKKQPK